MNRLVAQNASVSKTQDVFKVNSDDNFQLSGQIGNNILELNNIFAMKAVSSYSFLKHINWHTRFNGHPSFFYLKRIIPDIEKIDCSTCRMCKGANDPLKGKFTPTLEILEAIYLDLVGPFQTQSEGGAQYFLTVVDQYSVLKSVKMLRHKSKMFSKFENWVAWAENQAGQWLKHVISDNGGEFKNLFVEDFCRKKRDFTTFLASLFPQEEQWDV
jgi:hypothetical protein